MGSETDPAVWLVLANALSTWLMTGVIWFVQLVHYPLFASYNPATFRQSMADHQRRTSWVVGPPMLVEGLTAIALVIFPPHAVPSAIAWLGLGFVFVWALSTIAIQIPLHTALERDGFDPVCHARLVQTNWIRTFAWTVRSIIVGFMLASLGCLPR